MLALIIGLLAQEAGHEEPVTEPIDDLTPPVAELIVGFIAFLVFFFFVWKWVLPRVNSVLEERRAQIQGNLEKAESTRSEADQLLADYRQQLAGAREEANRIIEDARATAEQLRRDIQAKAEQEAQATVARAQDEIRAERDRVLQELSAQVGDIAVELAGRVVGQSLDRGTHERLIDDYIDEVSRQSGSNGRS